MFARFVNLPSSSATRLTRQPQINCESTCSSSPIPKSGQEALQLKIADIDSKRWLVHIHRGKGAKDRLVPLPHSTFLELRSYWGHASQPGLDLSRRRTQQSRLLPCAYFMSTFTVRWPTTGGHLIYLFR